MSRLAVIVLAASLGATGCGDSADDAEPLANVEGSESTDQFPEILEVEPTFDVGTSTWSFAVTVSSPYDTPERYADGWRVIGPDGTVFGVHELTHDHAAEQPFTRTQSDVEIPTGVDEVTIEGRDLVNGFGGTTFTLDLQAGTP